MYLIKKQLEKLTPFSSQIFPTKESWTKLRISLTRSNKAIDAFN
jgi:hypothetical protein